MDALVIPTIVVGFLAACFLRWRRRHKEGRWFIEGQEIGAAFRVIGAIVLYITILTIGIGVPIIVVGEFGVPMLTWVVATAASFIDKMNETMNEPITAMTRGEIFIIIGIILVYADGARREARRQARAMEALEELRAKLRRDAEEARESLFGRSPEA